MQSPKLRGAVATLPETGECLGRLARMILFEWNDDDPEVAHEVPNVLRAVPPGAARNDEDDLEKSWCADSDELFPRHRGSQGLPAILPKQHGDDGRAV
jgi:hypothetical protein